MSLVRAHRRVRKLTGRQSGVRAHVRRSKVTRHGRPSSHRVLLLLWPYLSEPKQEQAYAVWDELAKLQRPKSPLLPPLPERGW